MEEDMVPHSEKEARRWLQLQLWGLDAPITAVCWAVACAALMQITMMTPAPLLLVAGVVWCVNMWLRLAKALKSPQAWQADFYRSNVALLVVLQFAVSMATLYIMFFYVGRSVLGYMAIPLIMLLLARFCAHRYLQLVQQLLLGTALAMMCALPAFYFSFTLTPLHVLVTGPIWYLGLLFFLTTQERNRLRNEAGPAASPILNTLTLLLLLTAALISSVTAPMFERTLCVTIAIGAGCLQGFSRLNHLIPPYVALALSWLTMALPAILGIILYAPSHW